MRNANNTIVIKIFLINLYPGHIFDIVMNRGIVGIGLLYNSARH